MLEEIKENRELFNLCSDVNYLIGYYLWFVQSFFFIILMKIPWLWGPCSLPTKPDQKSNPEHLHLQQQQLGGV